jgi:sugar lactone lactonase YvrE
MRRSLALPLLTALLSAPLAGLPASSSPAPATLPLTGDAGGSKFEGIGVSPDQRTFYVSEVTGGEIHRGSTQGGTAEEWLPEGADARFTARGVTTDAAGRVYIAGGPNGIGTGGIGTGRPDLWVYDASGRLLAALRVGVDNAFLNDVAIGPDGAAYFTNSNAPQVFRVALADGAWQSEVWADATGTIPVSTGFNLGGIVVSDDDSALVVAQGNVGKLWRFDLATGAATEVATGGAPLVNADGLVARGDQLYVVRNFSRALTRLTLSADGSVAALVSDTPTAADRVLTTAKLARGRLLAVDSKFDEGVAAPPYEVVVLPVPRDGADQ